MRWPKRALRHRQAFEAAARATGIPVWLLVAIARQESNFNSSAVGSAGELGLMQIMIATGASLGFGPSQLSTPAANVMAGAKLLVRLVKAFPDDLAAVLVAYNAGEGTARRIRKSHGGRIPRGHARRRYADSVMRHASLITGGG